MADDRRRTQEGVRRVDGPHYSSYLSQTSCWCACSLKRDWPEVGEIVSYGMNPWRIVRREEEPGEAIRYVAFMEPL